MIRIFYLLLLATICATVCFAEATPQEKPPFFNREEYRKAAEEFNYKKPVPLTKVEKKKVTKKNWDWLKYLSYLLIIGVIVFLIYRLILYTYSPDNKKLKNTEILTSLPEEEPTIDSNLLELLEIALQENNYKEAIRIYYLLSIKDLNDNKIVTYTIDKTNFDYLSEVGGHPAFNLFRDLTIHFEHIWFGDTQADEIKLNNYKLKYNGLNDIILSNRNKKISI